jgi:hypothetical protein
MEIIPLAGIKKPTYVHPFATILHGHIIVIS